MDGLNVPQLRQLLLELRQNIMPAISQHLSASTQLLNSIHASAQGLSMAELLTHHPSIPRRSAQRHVANLVANGQVITQSDGRGTLAGTGTIFNNLQA